MRVITVAWLALVPAEALASVRERLVQLRVRWSGLEGGPVEALGPEGPRRLAFDHAEIIGAAVLRVRERLRDHTLAGALMPERFTLRRLQEAHEALLGRSVNKPSFRRRMLASGEVVPTGEHEDAVDHRPAELYRAR